MQDLRDTILGLVCGAEMRGTEIQNLPLPIPALLIKVAKNLSRFNRIIRAALAEDATRADGLLRVRKAYTIYRSERSSPSWESQDYLHRVVGGS